MERLLIIALFLFQVGVINSAGVADVFIAYMIMVSLFKFKLKKNYFDVSFFTLILFLTIVILGASYTSLYSSQAFLNNLLRISSLSLGYFLIPLWFYNRPKKLDLLMNSMSIALIIVSLLAIVEFIGIQFDVVLDMRLIHRGIYEKIEDRVYAIFSEPSIVSIFIAGFISPILYFYRNRNEMPKIATFSFYISLITLFITTSIIGLVFMLLLIIYYVIYVKRIKNPRTVVFSVCSLLLILVLLQGTFGNEVYLERIQSINSGDDNSANQRLFGSWLYALSSIHDKELFGIGLGQASVFSEVTNVRVDFFSEFNKVVNNSFAAILLELGYVGLIAYVIFIFSVFKKKYFLLIIFLLFCFAHGGYVFSFFWFFLYWGRIFNLQSRYKLKLHT